MPSSFAIVTGAAGGIGGACAARLAATGYAVLAADLGGAAPSADQIASLSAGEILPVGLDVADGAAIDALAALCDSAQIRLVIVVNAAGIFQDIMPLEEFDNTVHDRLWRINYHGTYRMCRSFGLQMASRGGGAIVNISSINAMRSTPLLAYAPAKAAINALTGCLAAELGPRGVRVNAVCPGFTLTPTLADKVARGLRDESAILRSTALQAWVSPDDIAAAVHFLVSDEAKTITGICLPVDAGWLAGVSWSTFGGVRAPPTSGD